MIFRLALAAIVGIVSEDAAAAPVIGIVIAAAFAYVFARCRPFKDPDDVSCSIFAANSHDISSHDAPSRLNSIMTNWHSFVKNLLGDILNNSLLLFFVAALMIKVGNSLLHCSRVVPCAMSPLSIC